jgi:hypothetical protein
MARGALIFALAAGAVWAVGIVGLALVWLDGRSGWTLAAALLALAALGPVVAAVGLRALLLSGERLERRLARLERLASAAEAAAEKSEKRGPESAETLARAMATAAREALDAERGAMARRLAEIGEAQRVLGKQIEQMAALPAAPQPAPPPAKKPEADAQPNLPLGAGAAAEPAAINWVNVAVALDFPRDADDARGFAALRAAVRHRTVSEVLQGAEDILTILSQDGLYMEDMTAAPPPLDVWRAYLDGARGREVAAICGVEDEEAEAKIRARMQSDPIFRDTAMHLIRRFDAMLRRAFAECRSEAELRAVIDNRTGRAFMLIAKVVGSFD